MLFYQRNERIGHFLNFLFSIYSNVLAQTVLLHFFHLFNGVPSDVADGHFGLFAFILNPFYYFFPSFLGHGGKKNADDATIILWGHTYIGGNDGTLNQLQHVLLPGLNGKGSGISNRNIGHLGNSVQ